MWQQNVYGGVYPITDEELELAKSVGCNLWRCDREFVDELVELCSIFTNDAKGREGFRKAALELAFEAQQRIDPAAVEFYDWIARNGFRIDFWGPIHDNDDIVIGERVYIYDQNDRRLFTFEGPQKFVSDHPGFFPMDLIKWMDHGGAYVPDFDDDDPIAVPVTPTFGGEVLESKISIEIRTAKRRAG
ncbi:MAG: hypothetical protein O2995_15180 [Proteobacteria bacterium]|nr:hypothetical protein [Pseudomonadota bacterium]MDA1308332.1 hypothetical protein [Pseudomonadota bacterium]